MKKLLLILIALPMVGFGQNVNIPDANFKAVLVGNSTINTNGDSEIQVSEATAFNGTIDCESMNISNLTGIEAFTALEILQCGSNNLTSLDVTSNTSLIELWCSYTQLTSFDVSNNTNLTYLILGTNQLTSLDVSNNLDLTFFSCQFNQLTSLDVSANLALSYLYCSGNLLSNLDVSANTALISLSCSYNQLTCLDVSNNTVLTYLSCSNNLLEQLNTKNSNWQNLDVEAINNNLTCVEVDNLGYANTNWATTFDSFVTFSTNCNYTNPCSTVSAIEEQITNKELLKVTDLLGRETKGTKNEVLFYIYDDGTVEKRIVIE